MKKNEKNPSQHFTAEIDLILCMLYEKIFHQHVKHGTQNLNC